MFSGYIATMYNLMMRYSAYEEVHTSELSSRGTHILLIFAVCEQLKALFLRYLNYDRFLKNTAVVNSVA